MKVGVYSACNSQDTWNWTAQGSLECQKSMCLEPISGASTPDNNEFLVLRPTCNNTQHTFTFVPSKYCVAYLKASKMKDL